ncbi:MAG TPA: xanthine dehydrogenase family protein subunit M [Candidatus Binatia bacterium]
MTPFNHVNAASMEEAVSLLERHGREAKVIAGGQDLLFRLKKNLSRPKILVNLKTVPGSSGISFDEKVGLRLGALTTLAAIEDSTIVQERFQVLGQAAGRVASLQIRNMGTLGGNLCQDVWCWYLQSGFSCWKNGGTSCDLVTGDSLTYGSVLGGYRCLAVHPSDTAPALLALDAKVDVVTPRGARTLSIEELLPGQTVVDGFLQSHALQHDELISQIIVPVPPPNSRSLFLKHTLRQVWDFALASVALTLVLEDGQCRDARIVLGGIGTAPARSREAEQLLIGNTITPELAMEAGEVALRRARPLRTPRPNDYKVDLSKALIKRALVSLAA